ncbi:hypothetical protein A200_08333 [Parascardovia denticolens IPLA 20019]|nr:hypothetical protein A200_08333 [Parascardovia denticolens IPLA 20019]
MEITNEGYKDENWHVGHEFKIDNKKTYLGKVTRMVRGRDGVKGDNPSGLDALLVKDPKTKTIRVIYQGSRGNMLLSKDWAKNDWPMAGRIMGSSPSPPPVPDRPCPPLLNILTRPSMPDLRPPWVTGQLKDASRLLKKTLKDNPGYSVEVYGHSLGSMDGQYAVSSLDEAEAKRIKGAWLYEGPNIYPALNEGQKKRARSYGSRVKNYVDSQDLVPIGYGDDKQAVGQVRYVESTDAGGSNPMDHIGKQHSWGGYQWASDGSLALTEQTIDTLQQDRQTALASLRSQWEKDGGALSAGQKIYLDYQQAMSLLTALRQELARTEITIKAAKDSCVQTANAVWTKGMHDIYESLIYLSLSMSGLVDIATQEGHSKQRFADQATASVDAYRDRVKKAHESLDELTRTTSAALKTLLDKDAHLATRFRQWDTQLNHQETNL